MTERQLQTRFKNTLSKKLKEENIPFFLYKIPDTRGLGGIRPFDSILFLQGRTFAIEFKVGKNKLIRHQEYYLNLIKLTKNTTMTINEHNYKKIAEIFVRCARYSRDLYRKIYKRKEVV